MEMQEVLIRDLPPEEKPRERMVAYGVEALSNVELLAIMMRTGARNISVLTIAKMILKQTNGLEKLSDISVAELKEIPGVGSAKAMQICAGIELGKRVLKTMLYTDNVGKPYKTPEDCFRHLHAGMKFLTQEHFVVLFLDAKHRLIRKETVFIGTINATAIHPREIFRSAVKNLAAFIICVHNHPSMDVTPSPADILVTKQLVRAGELMSIPLLDHVIIGGNDYCSMKTLGYLKV